GAGRDWFVRAPEAGRNTGLRQGHRAPRTPENADCRAVLAILGTDAAGRGVDGGVLRAVLHLHRVLAELWGQDAGLQP
nr:hypothetical protein [Tanacetum cinerariifolium]